MRAARHEAVDAHTHSDLVRGSKAVLDEQIVLDCLEREMPEMPEAHVGDPIRGIGNGLVMGTVVWALFLTISVLVL